MQSRTVVGLDVGRSAIKVVSYANGVRFSIMYPTLAVPAVALTDPATAERAKAETKLSMANPISLVIPPGSKATSPLPSA